MSASEHIPLLRRLLTIADKMVDDRTIDISDATLRQLKGEIKLQRLRVDVTHGLIDYEATCLIETIAELAYARSERSERREQRAIMYINSLTCFMWSDLRAAEKRLAAS
ncbi:MULTISPECIES: hypothetical protein [Rhodopseudomonas]|uniref:Uncharacterized protein n=1 Tax=Rhodopseudomonas palustris TaxID=1076 RepID=A0A0D7EEU8_RHOPL|nr:MULTISPECIES: hypothetical protein [Rhodopseudomonas]KIZ39055.1 hypothetical protein OO17_21595 [Rhodopseudomonas palustris]MDF3809282.1 hypothetical protein [Rhodopseudomonas sp. BAL398]WOK19034.1 hypothetical protein RBJ75_05815 [Rhodopseudomonas sp. BAL398]